MQDLQSDDAGRCVDEPQIFIVSRMMVSAVGRCCGAAMHASTGCQSSDRRCCQVGNRYVARVYAVNTAGLIGNAQSPPLAITTATGGFSSSSIAIVVAVCIIIGAIIVAMFTCYIVRMRCARKQDLLIWMRTAGIEGCCNLNSGADAVRHAYTAQQATRLCFVLCGSGTRGDGTLGGRCGGR